MKSVSKLLLLASIALAGCSTEHEAKVSQTFQGDYDKVVAVHEKTADGSIYSASQPGFFVGDRRAHSIGDVLTVALQETTQASKSNDANVSRKGSTALSLPAAIFGPLGLNAPALRSGANFGANSDQSYTGKGTADQSNSITGTVTVMVTRVYENGNMWIEGQKMLTLNQGEEYLRVTGLVRPEDIKPGNVVDSGRVAQAQISYTGSGDLADSTKQNWFGRFFGWASPI